MMERLIILILLIFISLSTKGAASTSVYQPLADYIKSRSDPLTIPRTSTDRPLVVDFQAGWLDIQRVDYEHSRIEGIFATAIAWNSGIRWNPADFSGKTSIVLSSADMYRPTFTVVNAVGKLQTWHNERVSCYANGATVVRQHYRGTIFCNEELRDSNACRIRVSSYATTNDVISFLEPAKRLFDLRKIYDNYYFEGSQYNLTSHRYEIQTRESQPTGMAFEYMDYIFSFEEKESNRDSSQFQSFIFEFI